MKKILLIISLIAGTAFALSAQTRIIPKVGVNLFNFDENYDDGEFNGKSGFHIGADIRSGDKFYVSIGGQYFRYNSRFEGIGGLFDYDVKMEGVRIPLYIGGDFISGDRLGFRLFTGPSAAFILSTDDGLPGFEDNAFNDVRRGFNVGTGLDLGIISLDLQYEFGLNNVFSNKNIEAKSNILFLSAGILF